MPDRIIIDIETQKDFASVEGRRLELLGVSVVGVYSYSDNQYDAYLEADLPRLIERLKNTELMIGFNNRRFDNPVLQPYIPFNLESIPVLDIMDDVVKALGHRVSLDSIGQATFGRGKTGHGLDAIKWYKEGRFDLITQYCLDDVRLTKDVYEQGRKFGKLFATDRLGTGKIEIPVFWPDRKRPVETLAKMVQEACDKRLKIQIECLEKKGLENKPSQPFCVDVYFVREPFFEGLDHRTQTIEQFRIERLIEVKPVWTRYTVPADYVPTAVAA